MPEYDTPRDEFPSGIRQLLAKRVAYRCSNPRCRQSTSGPQEDPMKAINIGVASHITAASPGGPRYDTTLSPEERCGFDNGIWLCQKCAKLVDSDPKRYTTEILRQWKAESERLSGEALEVRPGSEEYRDDPFSKIERLMPDLLAEMRKDIAQYPLCREFVALKKSWSFWPPERTVFTYYYEDHDELEGKLRILENLGLIRDIRHNAVARFAIEEQFADYLAAG